MNLPVIKEMVLTINNINSYLHPEWTKQGWNWNTAIAMEAAEGLESHGWKWWKEQEPNVANCKMELIDIWHFMLGKFIENYGLDNATKAAASALNASEAPAGFTPKELWRLLMRDSNYSAFNSLRKRYQLSDVDFAALFFAKAELNLLRWKNGYKDGRYKKEWNYAGGLVEDNVAAADIAADYDLSNPDHVAQFRVKLAACYDSQPNAS